MKKFGLRRSMIALVALTLCIGLAFWLLPSGEQDWTVRIATATPGGTYYPLGIQLAHILKDEVAEIRDASIWETSGSVQNIRLLAFPNSRMILKQVWVGKGTEVGSELLSRGFRCGDGEGGGGSSAGLCCEQGNSSSFPLPLPSLKNPGPTGPSPGAVLPA